MEVIKKVMIDSYGVVMKLGHWQRNIDQEAMCNGNVVSEENGE